MSIKAVIFDMDDLLINSHPVHMLAFEKVFVSYGYSFRDNPLSVGEETGLFGMKISEVIDFFKQRCNVSAPAAEINEKYNQEIIPVFKKHVEEMPGARDLVNRLNKKGYLLAIASSAIGEKVDIVLRHLQLEKAFKAKVTGEEVTKGKPEPEIFLKALTRLNNATGRFLKSQECLVIEDATNGIESANRANMCSIGVHNQPMFIRLGIRQDLSRADCQVNALADITVMLINKIEKQ